ncbi:agmatinase family protein [Paraglaciecola sp. 2405UD69-4]|uniref:agmatinase family protein n=1 Tax=Paraglaciecola sp. 2405UD69-4 TaxID=3391836 RepID=UPI0039C929B2
MMTKRFLSKKLALTAQLASILIGFSACTIGYSEPASTSVNLPPTDSAKLGLLTDEELSFLRDSKKLAWFGLTEEKLFTKLATRDDQGVKTLISDMLITYQAAHFQEGQGTGSTIKNGVLEPLSTSADIASIPINTQAGGFNKGTIISPAILDEYKRSPGPINLQRYVHEEDGIPTFAGAPVAIRTEDLVAGNIEVAFVGVPLALGSGWRDAQHAPTVLRGMYGLAGYDIAGGVDPSMALNIADFGNVTTDYLSLELSVDHIKEQIGSMMDAGVVPFIVGGDHAIMYPNVAATTDHYGKENVGVIQLDAHFNGKRGLAHYYSDEQSVSRLIEDELLLGENLIQVGLRGPSQDKEALQWLKDQGVVYHTMAEIGETGWKVAQNKIIKQAKSYDSTFISFDISVLDPAYAPGAGRPIPGGLSITQATTLVRRLCAETQVTGFEILDITPYLDVSYKTALNANYVMHACLTGIAMRKMGNTQPNHIDPLAFSE